MKPLAHKSAPELVFQFPIQEWGSNHLRCQEFVANWQQNMQFQIESQRKGLLEVQVAQQGNMILLLLKFESKDTLIDWCKEHWAYTEFEFNNICRDLGKNPQTYIQQAHNQQGFSFHF